MRPLEGLSELRSGTRLALAKQEMILADIRSLNRRVAALEQLVSAHIRAVEKGFSDLADRLSDHRTRFAGLEAAIKELGTHMAGVKDELETFRRDLRAMIAETMREVLRATIDAPWRRNA